MRCDAMILVSIIIWRVDQRKVRMDVFNQSRKFCQHPGETSL